MPGLIRGASKGRGRGKEVLSVARACDLLLLMIDVFETHVDVLADELHLAGIRLNERPADVTLTKANRGGLTVNPTVKLTKLDAEMVADICREWGYLNGTVVVRQDITEDQLIDVLAGNRVFLRAFVVVNKIDLVSSDYVKQLQAKLPGWKLVPISAEKGVGLTRLKDEIYSTLRFMRVFLKPQGKEADMADPMIVKQDSDVGMVCDAIHRDWRKREKKKGGKPPRAPRAANQTTAAASSRPSLRLRNAYTPSTRTMTNDGTPSKTDLVAIEPTRPTTAPEQIRAPASRSGSAVMSVDLTRGGASASGPLRTASRSEGCRLRGVRR